MSVNPKQVIAKLAAGETLSSEAMAAALEQLSTGDSPPAQMAAFLMGLRVRGETLDELTGAARFLRSHMLAVEAPEGAIDIVGTGGDGHATYNVSTCAAFVAAGAGLHVAKHGNRSVSSLSGASDVLAALGVKLEISPATISQAIKTAGVGFLWAPLHHPAMKVWAPIRADLGIRTLFNLMGPISNPAGVKRQVVGVFDERWIEPIAGVLRNVGSEHAWVVHGADGLDELSTTGPTSVAELKAGTIRTFEVTPEEAGLSRSTLAALKGGDAKVNASALRDVLTGKPGPYRDIVLLNAAAALIVGGKTATLADGVKAATQSIETGKAARALETLIRISNS
jgi:anthranilate phosphoribosyltransferase